MAGQAAVPRLPAAIFISNHELRRCAGACARRLCRGDGDIFNPAGRMIIPSIHFSDPNDQLNGKLFLVILVCKLSWILRSAIGSLHCGIGISRVRNFL